MKQTCPIEIQRFLDAVTAVFAVRPLPCDGSVETGKKITGALETVRAMRSTNVSAEFPALSYLDKAISVTENGSNPISDLTRALKVIAPRLPWYCRQAPDLIDFMNGHANAEIVGPRGLEIRNDLSIGVTVMAPEIQYPDHNHPPDEIYIVLSDGEWRQEDRAWQTPGPGGYVFNPSNITHAMRSGKQPLLAVWCLWIG